MKKVLILSLLCASAYMASAQSDYTTYQVAFRQGNKILTIQPDFATATTTPTAHTQKNDMSQHLIFKRQADGSLLIASAASPDKFLKRVGTAVSFADYDAAQVANYKWLIRGTVSVSNTVASTSEGNKLLGLLVNPLNAGRALTLQADGSMQMSLVNYTLSDDPYRIYIVKKQMPGKF